MTEILFDHYLFCLYFVVCVPSYAWKLFLEDDSENCDSYSIQF